MLRYRPRPLAARCVGSRRPRDWRRVNDGQVQTSALAPTPIAMPLGDKGPEPESAAKEDFCGGVPGSERADGSSVGGALTYRGRPGSGAGVGRGVSRSDTSGPDMPPSSV